MTRKIQAIIRKMLMIEGMGRMSNHILEAIQMVILQSFESSILKKGVK